MPLIAKRKLDQTWRDAVEARAGPESGACLEAFDAALAAGCRDAEAAFRSLASLGLLWRVDEPGSVTAAQGAAGRDDAPTGEVPPV